MPSVHLRTQLPLKQWLRPYKAYNPSITDGSQNPTSTKTRIKTCFFLLETIRKLKLRTQLPLKQGLRQLLLCKIWSSLASLRTQLPLKQGLRQQNKITYTSGQSTQNPTSTKTRIKTFNLWSCLALFSSLRTQLPLKQGLRPWPHESEPSIFVPQNPTSTKTRIKTMESATFHHWKCRLRTQLPLKQGLRLELVCFHTEFICNSEPNFH